MTLLRDAVGTANDVRIAALAFARCHSSVTRRGVDTKRKGARGRMVKAMERK
jgi:hypothetical protein